MLSPGELPSCLLSDDASATSGCPGELPSLVTDEASVAFYERPASAAAAMLSPLPSDTLSNLFEASDVSPGRLSDDLSPVLAVGSPFSSASSSVPAVARSGLPWKGAPMRVQATSPPLLPTPGPTLVANAQGGQDGNPPRCESQTFNPASPTHMAPDAANSSKQMWQLSDFELGPCIGVGSFGRIVAARERQSKAVVVLKAMKKRRVERLKVQRHLAHEIEIQAHLRHPNILQLFGFFWDASHIFMILEHAPKGDLCQMLEKQPNQRFSEHNAAPLVAQVMGAVDYLHQMHVIHRDLKPANILVVRYRQVKLADFGWAVHTYPEQARWTLCGTLDYLPPEIVHADHGHSFGVDIWGLGVLMYELLEGHPPFSAPSCEETYLRILKASPVFAFQEVEAEKLKEGVEVARLSAGARSLVSALLKKLPADRLPLREALVRPWFKEFAHDCSSGGNNLAAHAGA